MQETLATYQGLVPSEFPAQEGEVASNDSVTCCAMSWEPGGTLTASSSSDLLCFSLTAALQVGVIVIIISFHWLMSFCHLGPAAMKKVPDTFPGALCIWKPNVGFFQLGELDLSGHCDYVMVTQPGEAS